MLTFADPAQGTPLYLHMHVNEAITGSGGLQTLTIEAVLHALPSLASLDFVVLGKSQPIAFTALLAGSHYTVALTGLGDVIDASTGENLLDAEDFSLRYLGAFMTLSTGTTVSTGNIDLWISHEHAQVRPPILPKSFADY
jgi:hypothetical protein